MIKIKKILSMCPAPPGWMAHYEDESPSHVAMWVLVETQDLDQEIVAMTDNNSGIGTIDQLNFELNNCLRFDFVDPRI